MNITLFWFSSNFNLAIYFCSFRIQSSHLSHEPTVLKNAIMSQQILAKWIILGCTIFLLYLMTHKKCQNLCLGHFHNSSTNYFAKQ